MNLKQFTRRPILAEQTSLPAIQTLAADKLRIKCFSRCEPPRKCTVTCASTHNGNGASGTDKEPSSVSTNSPDENQPRPAEAYIPPSRAGPSNAADTEAEVQSGNGNGSRNGSTKPRELQSAKTYSFDTESDTHTVKNTTQPHLMPSTSHTGKVRLRKGSEGPMLASSDEDGPLNIMKINPIKALKDAETPDIGTLWGLLILGLAYVHHSTTGFALPALLPLITPELQLSDTQGSALTAGYTILYAIALVPVGFLADKADRPRMLAAGLTAWSILTVVASKVHNFGELLATRIFFAMAQATQNPICFSLIPELFRKDRTTAMAAYNSAIYMGRALSFAAVIVAGKLGMANSSGDIGVTMVPLDSLDLSHVSILYTQGEMAAITPIYDYQFSILHTTVTISSWRQLLSWLGPPGLAIAALALLTLDEPRKPKGNFLGDVFSSSKFTNSATRDLNRSQKDKFAESRISGLKSEDDGKKGDKDSLWAGVKELVSSPVFQAVTLAATFNDVGSWALVSWQATFYQRVYELGPDVYAPALAGILPIGGIIGGVGGGLTGDWLAKRGGLQILTAGATIAACPVLVGNLLAPDSTQSFAFLLFGFALSEMWRAPAAIMIRDVSPPNLGSTGSAVHLCIRNLIGGIGPVSVAWLSKKVGLQYAMLLVPAMYFLSGVTFFFAHKIQDAEKAKKEQSAITAAK